MTGFAERGVLSSIMTFTEVVNAIARVRWILDAGRFHKQVGSQVTYDHMGRSRRIVGGNSDMPTSFVAGLRQLAHRIPLHRKIGSGHLNQGGSDSRHDQRKKERIPFLSSRVDVRHERRLVEAWSQGIDEVEKKSEDQ